MRHASLGLSLVFDSLREHFKALVEYTSEQALLGKAGWTHGEQHLGRRRPGAGPPAARRSTMPQWFPDRE
jgi:hypothetical protein